MMAGPGLNAYMKTPSCLLVGKKIKERTAFKNIGIVQGQGMEEGDIGVKSDVCIEKNIYIALPS